MAMASPVGGGGAASAATPKLAAGRVATPGTCCAPVCADIESGRGDGVLTISAKLFTSFSARSPDKAPQRGSVKRGVAWLQDGQSAEGE